MLHKSDQDRFLFPRNGVLYYWRRVPKTLAAIDSRAPLIRHSLKTDDLAKARAQRDVLEKADNQLWAAMLLEGREPSQALEKYQAARLLCEAMGFNYYPVDELAQQPIPQILQRMNVVKPVDTPAAVAAAVLGAEPLPKVKVSGAFKVYCEEIVADELTGKSPAQRERWKNVKKRAINSFINVVGDKPMVDITRDDGRTFYKFWLAKLVNKNAKDRRSASMCNRMVGNLRVLYDSYFKHLGEFDRQNPFASFWFADKFKKTRPPFSVDWIKTKVLKPGALARMNPEGRAIVLTLVETGARPSEICNLTEPFIKLDDPVPHILIEPRLDPDDPREIKTATSIRAVPLVGAALAAMKKFPKGFARYKDKESSMSAALNKFFRENELFPTPKHKIYSFRHSFEDRLKNAGVDDELRRLLMGHAIDRPKYGAGGSLEWRQAELLKLALPFDETII
ncbi:MULTISPECIES: tyrosine-type recombinase/integrase [Afipia]|uniref:Integrase n=1 Tax=Afipia massiliensis TaxID=211460 RepID=A0A840N084_9BRAD|nr:MULTISPECIES: tyrosine-type recombinase/integrase [Afipia]MBB5051887.1 integrase [Afipia massiliensis]MCR6736053.1 tyrosine-type recombinase/integrase [Afipia sp.]